MAGSDGSPEGVLTSIPINLQGRNNATIEFSWFFTRFDNNEYLAVDLSTDGGGIWTEMARLQGNVDPANIWQAVSLSAENITSLHMRFRNRASKPIEYANVDLVRVTAF